MKKYLLHRQSFFLLFFFVPLFSFAQPAGAHPDWIIDWNEAFDVGVCSANGLVLPKGDPIPEDYSAPLFTNFGIEVGFRHTIFFDKETNVSFAAEAPVQLGIVSSTGPSVSVPKNSTSIWLSGAAMVTMNKGLGAVYENSDNKLGAYLGIGIGYNKAMIREKLYTFYYTTPLQETLPFRYVGYFTANGMTGFRWRNRNGVVKNLGIEGNYGIYGEWMVGISFGMVLDM